MPARVVLLNGASSVGKSSIAKAIQALASGPYLHVAMDAFLEMMPIASVGHPDGLVFETIQQDGEPSVVIKSGPWVERTLRGMRHAIAAMAPQGNSIVVDDVLLGGEASEYERLLAPYRFYKVGVFAPLAVIEERERARGDRAIGLARWQFGRVHEGMRYDLEVDASKSPAECAAQIVQRFGL